MNDLLHTALTAAHETSTYAFRTSFDVHSQSDWVTIIRDIIAMSNSGGGLLLIGLNPDGTPSGFNVSSILAYERSQLTAKLLQYTGTNIENVTIAQASKYGRRLAVFEVGRAAVPLICTAGGYQDVHGKKRQVLQIGVVYFRHGPASEPGTPEDLQMFLRRELEARKAAWLREVRKVLEAPEGAQILVVLPSATPSPTPSAQEEPAAEDSEAQEHPLVEEEVLAQYPISYRELLKMARARYSDFVANKHFLDLKRRLERDPRYALTRLLYPARPGGIRRTTYSSAIFQVLDAQYTRREEAVSS